MQYTAASFAEPILIPVGQVFTQHVHENGPTGYFPVRAEYERHWGDVAAERVFGPLVRWGVGIVSRLRVLEHGKIHLYVAYVLATVVVLLAWQVYRVRGN